MLHFSLIGRVQGNDGKSAMEVKRLSMDFAKLCEMQEWPKKENGGKNMQWRKGLYLN